MDNKEKIIRELEEIAPLLQKARKKNPFKTPDYYFQSFPDKMMDRVRGSQSPIPWFERLENSLNDFFSLVFRPRLAIPASAALLSLVVAVAVLKNNYRPAADVTRPLSEISSEEIRRYALDHFDDDDLMAFSTTNGMNGFIPADISDETLEDYINANYDNQILEEDNL